MDTVTRTEFFAKPEVHAALVTVKEAARRALPAASFAQREAAILALFEEAGRGLLEEDLQSLGRFSTTAWEGRFVCVGTATAGWACTTGQR